MQTLAQREHQAEASTRRLVVNLGEGFRLVAHDYRRWRGWDTQRSNGREWIDANHDAEAPGDALVVEALRGWAAHLNMLADALEETTGYAH